jgi:hypothetical protein
LSWDNLSTKGVIPCRPSVLLAWNAAHARDAVEIHRLHPASVVITGAPFFDKWFHLEDDIEPRSKLLERLRLPHDAKYLLYLGSSTTVAADESWLVRKVREALDRTPSVAHLHVVVRPHPKNTQMIGQLSDVRSVLLDETSVPYSDEKQRHLLNVIHHAEAFLGINTSGMVDAILIGKPGFSILSERYRDTHSGAAHFRDLLGSDALYVSDDADAFARQLAGVLGGNDPKAGNRRRFVSNFIRPRGLDVDAGLLQAHAIAMLAEGKSACEIDTALGGIARQPVAPLTAQTQVG